MAATTVGEIGLDLVVNQNQFKTQMAGIGNVAKKAGTALAAAFSVKKIVDFGKSCLELGSDLAEVQNVVDVTFPHMTAQVDKFAQSAAKSFGLSETMAKQYTGTFGAMAKAFGFTEKQAYDMSTALTGLAGDVASFYNISQDEAYIKLKSVFTGETESLKDLGVVMTQTALDAYAMANGFGKTTAQMSEAEKVALRYAFVQDQLTAATGDFSRTADSWANQCRIMKLQFDSLKASIGQGLINLFTPVLRVINSVIGRLTVLASAFKSFTELITGKKSSTQEIADAGNAASAGMDSAAESADNAAKSTNKTANAVKKAAKEMRSLMGFDKINKLDKKTDDSTVDNTATDGNAPLTDFGNLAQGETTIDKTDKKMQDLINHCKELAKLFKKGFQIGFGDSDKKIASINAGLKNIGRNLKEIFTDSAVVDSANRCANSIVLAFGKIAGSFARIGLTLADNLIGGMDKYLEDSKDYIKQNIVSIFDVTSEIADLIGNFAVAIADIFDVFSSDNAKQITADLIGIFADGFLGVTTLGLKFVRDVAKLVATPVTRNVNKIKTAFENILLPIRIILDTIHQAVKDTFAKINEVYDDYVAPFFDSLTEGISEITSVFLDGFNEYIAPVLKDLATEFDKTWKNHIQPALDGILELLGSCFDSLRILWEDTLQPFVKWIVKNIMPILSPIIKNLGKIFLDVIASIADAINGFTKILKGLIDFLTGMFAGDWKKTFDGLKTIAEGFKIAFEGVWKYIKNTTLGNALSYIKNTFVTGWTMQFSVLKTKANNFKNNLKTIFNGVKTIFNSMITFVSGSFSARWSKAWQGIKNTFSKVFDGLGSLAKKPVNAMIAAFNSVLKIINSLISKINSIQFSIDIPDWIPGFGGSSWGFNGFNIAKMSYIPALAQGAYVKPNTPQLAMIGDNMHQGEFVAPEGKLKEMAKQAVREAGGVSKEELESIIDRAVTRIVTALMEMGFYVDSEQIGRAVRAAQTAADRRFNAVEVE